MTSIIEINRIVDPFGKIWTVTIQEVTDVQNSFLKLVCRKNVGEKPVNSVIESLVLSGLRSIKLIAQRGNVIKHFSAAVGEVPGDGWIGRSDVLIESVELDIDPFLDLGEETP